MSNLSDAGVTVEVFGKEYTFQPLTFADMEWLELRAKSKLIETRRLAMPQDLSPEEREKWMEDAWDRADKIDIFTNTESLMNPKGFILIIWRSVIKSHPEVTLDDVRQWMMDVDAMSSISNSMQLLLGFKKKFPAELPPKPETQSQELNS